MHYGNHGDEHGYCRVWMLCVCMCRVTMGDKHRACYRGAVCVCVDDAYMAIMEINMATAGCRCYVCACAG